MVNVVKYPMSKKLFDKLEEKRKKKIENLGYKIPQYKFIEEIVKKEGKNAIKKIKKRKYC